MKRLPILCFAALSVAARGDTTLIGPSTRNGGFEASTVASGTSFNSIPDWASYFPEGESGVGTDVLSTGNPRTGVNRLAVSGFSGTGTRLHPSQVIPAAAWTIEEGDSFRFTAHVRGGSRFDVGADSFQLILHVVDPVTNAPVPTATGNADRLLDHVATASSLSATTYTEVTGVSAPVPAGSPWIGKLLQPRMLVVGERIEFALVDDAELVAFRADPPAVALSSYPAEGSSDNAGPGTQAGTPDPGLGYGPGFGIGSSFSTPGGGVTIPAPPLSSFSIAFWMKAPGPGSEAGNLRWHDGSALVDGSATSATGFGISLRGSRIVAGDSSEMLTSRTLVSDARWHHIVFSRSPGGNFRLHVNGHLEDSGFSPENLPAIADLKLGASRLGGRAFSGLIDEVRIFSGVLTPEDITSIRIRPGDSDGDGFTDEEEAVAGTGWGDTSDLPKLRSISKGPGGVTVEIDGKRSRQYQLERNADLTATTPDAIPDAIAPLESDVPAVTLTDPSPPAGKAFYRVRAEKGPLPQPNILLIVGDDHGYADISAFPNARPDISTPHLDRLATSGSILTQAYVTAPVCSPSRCGFLTGRMQNEWDPAGGWAPRLPSNVKHLAEYLKEAGYATAMIGKNDFGQATGSTNNRDHPPNHGFDRFFGFNAHAHDFFLHSQAITNSVQPAWPTDASAHLGKFLNNQLPGGFETVADGKWQTELFTDRAIGYLQERANQQQPFFLYLSHASVHALIHQAPKPYLDAEDVPELPNYNPATNVAGNPSSYTTFYYQYSRPKPQEANGIIADADMRKYYRAHLKAYDDQMGRLFDSLDALGLEDNTIVIYFSDNGGEALTGANNQPLSGSKYTVFEGGLRTPMMISWPGRIPAGQTYTHVASALDVVPTLLDAAGVELAPQLRGNSLLEPLKNNAPVVPGERTLFWRFNDQWAIRKGDWKLVLGRKNLADKATSQITFNNAALNKISLFNLMADPGEMNDLSNSTNPAVQAIKADLQQRYNAWNASN